jgi:hypothetical protein
MKPLLLRILASAALVPSLQAAPVAVTVSDKVEQSGLKSIGLNLDWNNAGATPCTKKLVAENFEGSTYRRILTAADVTADSVSVWATMPENWAKVLKEHGTWRIVSGPAKGMTGKFKEITTKVIKDKGKDRTVPCVVFDKSVPVGRPGIGVAVEAFTDDEGYMISPRLKTNLGQNKLIHDDLPPGVFGKSALLLTNNGGEASYQFNVTKKQIEVDGTWIASFWAKAKGGNPTLSVVCPKMSDPIQVPIKAEWKHFDITVTPKDSAHTNTLSLNLVANSGDVAIDDVVISKDDGDANPTPFRRDFVENIRRYHPGQLRYLQMGGSTMENYLQLDPLYRQHFGSSVTANPGSGHCGGHHDYGLPGLLMLCEAIGADPWINLPGVLTEDEARQFAEYMGAPADVGMGKLRKQQGREKPWTESFSKIHIEYGNEAWNLAFPYNSGGYNGADYWEGLTETIKASPYTSSKYVFHAGSIAVNPFALGNIIKNNPSADEYAVAPYWIHSLKTSPPDFWAQLQDDAFLIRYAAAFIHRTVMAPEGYMSRNMALAKKAGKNISIYEENYAGWPGEKTVPDDRRNMFVYGYGPAIPCVYGYLLLQRIGVQHQNQFQFSGKVYGAVDVASRSPEVERPLGAAIKLVNECNSGDLLATTVTGAATMPIEAIFDKSGKVAYNDTPSFDAFAYKNGTKRSLVLFNLDPDHAQQATISLPAGAVKGATKHLLTGDIHAPGVEHPTTPPMTLKSAPDSTFRSGATVEIPPCSIVAFEWES